MNIDLLFKDLISMVNNHYVVCMYLKKGYGLIADQTTLNQIPNDTDRSPYDRQQRTKHITHSQL